ncbi:MAG: hypothetical protein E4H01_15325 [Lysobacterales bacterium]|nr:MAG: hypothetical protein E4H01_15325 [Xanthomonadales bacterium]
MLIMAERGDNFWPTKAEYYFAVSEIKNASGKVSMDQVSAVILALTDGSKADRIDHREWVKQTLRLLNRILSEK